VAAAVADQRSVEGGHVFFDHDVDHDVVRIVVIVVDLDEAEVSAVFQAVPGVVQQVHAEGAAHLQTHDTMDQSQVGSGIARYVDRRNGALFGASFGVVIVTEDSQGRRCRQQTEDEYRHQ